MNASNNLSFSAGRAIASRHHDAWMRQVRTFSGRRRQSQRALSREERRRQARELKRNQKGKETGTSKESKHESSLWKDRLARLMPRPRMPGGSSNFEKEEMISIAKRLPLFLILAGLVMYEDTSPLKVDQAFGPSMLPTIHPLGDVYLRATGGWQRALGIQIDYQVGDIVAISNSNGRGLNCKRIVGVAGDEVLRYGQFVDKYKDRFDLGILPPRQQASYNLSWDNDSAPGNAVAKDIGRKITVPKSHVWVEGDNPLFSVDSRHYGPVPLESIRGRLLMRIWPIWRREGVRPSPVLMSRDRPTPLALDEALAVHRYNLYKKSVPGVDDKPDWR
mmetsp:Transcript_32394/g.58580  ORF Transcript_32394/g.58580 Transcript_32394/m.58580 type:complete len:333 (+) Transcript_32394:149-1147(+)